MNKNKKSDVTEQIIHSDERANQVLQSKLAKEALALIELGGRETDISIYKQAIILIGKVGNISFEDTTQKLNKIDLYLKDAIKAETEGIPREDSLNRKEYGETWNGIETFDVLMGLFKITVQLEQGEDRCTLYNLARELIESQSFETWIGRRRDYQITDDKKRIEKISRNVLSPQTKPKNEGDLCL